MTVRALRVLGLVVVVTITGLLSGGAAGAAPTTAAIVSAAAGVLPGRTASDPAAAPAPAAPSPASAVGAPAPAPAASLPTPAVVAPAPAPAGVSGTPCRARARACIDLSENRAWLIRDGVVEYGPVPITHGRKGFRTPPGTFRVSFKNRDHVSSIYDASMPYSVFFNGGIAFHEGSLSQKSHGCIHLSRKAARTFFGSLARGDVVQVVR